VGPGIFHVLMAIGQERAANRIRSAISYFQPMPSGGGSRRKAGDVD